jgi:hypothetical protein
MFVRLRTAPWLLLAALASAAVAYQAFGLYSLVADMDSSFPMDLRVRWNEQRRIYHMLGVEVPEAPPVATSVASGVIGQRLVSYPPWTYATNWLFFPPIEWQTIRYYHAVLSVLALGLMGYWAYREGAAWGPRTGLLAAASLLAMFPITICVSYGQYSLLVTACLIACLLLCENGWDYLAGVCLGIALVKPQLAGLFVLGLLVRGRFRVVFTAAAYLVLASVAMGFWLGKTPMDLFAKASQESEGYYHCSHNPLIILLGRAIGLQPAALLLAAAGSATCAALVWRYGRSTSLLTTFSICAVVSMFWSYRRHYDGELLAFPLLALFVLSCRTQSRLAAATFLLFGLTLWAPARLKQWDMAVVQYAFAAVWAAGLAVLLGLQAAWVRSNIASGPEMPETSPRSRPEAATSTATA